MTSFRKNGAYNRQDENFTFRNKMVATKKDSLKVKFDFNFKHEILM